MASLRILVHCSFILLCGLTSTRSQTNVAIIRAGNFVGQEEVNVSFNGSVSVSCGAFNYTGPLTVPLYNNSAEFVAPFVVEGNLFEVVYNSSTRVALYLDSLVENGTQYAIVFYRNGLFWINVTSPGQQWRPQLGLDQALFIVTNEYMEPLEYSSVSSACYKCLPSNNVTILPGATQPIMVDSNYPLTYLLTFLNGTEACPNNAKHYHFIEGEEVTLIFERTGECSVLITNNSFTRLQTFLPIIYAGIALIGTALVWYLVLCAIALNRDKHCLHFRSLERSIAKDLGNPQETASLRKKHERLDYNSVNDGSPQLSPRSEKNKAKPERLLSLDAFRGFSLTIMLFVNYGGGGYYFFDHSLWHGLTVADLVFPWFIWIMGVSIVFSFKGRTKSSFCAQFYQVVRRSIILFGLGVFVNNGFHLDTWRIPGVLQRFGVTYFVCALTELLTSHFKLKDISVVPQHRLKTHIHDITNNWVQWIIMVTFTFLWLMITFLLPLDNGCPTGYLGPGGLSEGGKYFNCTGGAAGKIDNWILTWKHIYKRPTAQVMYHTGPYDPEGILGTLTSVVLCFLGVQCGRILTSYNSHGDKIARFVIWGILLGAIATGLCGGSQYDGVIPINKNLWSLSFVLLTGSFAFVLFILFYVLCDVVQVWSGSPFRFPGMNSILVYVSSDIFYSTFPFAWAQQGNSHLNYLSANVIAVVLWVLLSYYWYKINFFVKI